MHCRPAAKFLSFLLTLLLHCLSGDAHAQAAQVSLDLPGQPLSISLRAIAESAGINVLFDTEKLSGRTAPPLKARLNVDEAFSILLGGSGLRHHFIDEKTVILEPDPSAASK